MNLGIYGTGGLGKEIFDVACRENANIKKWESIFFIDDFSFFNRKSLLFT